MDLLLFVGWKFRMMASSMKKSNRHEVGQLEWYQEYLRFVEQPEASSAEVSNASVSAFISVERRR